MPELNTTVTAENNTLFLNGVHIETLPTPVPSVSLGQADQQTLSQSLAMHQTYRDAGFSVYHWRSSAVSLAWTSLGRVSGHLHQRTTLWDAIPGAALCRAAGLDVRLGSGPENELWIKAGDPAVHSIVANCWESNAGGSL